MTLKVVKVADLKTPWTIDQVEKGRALVQEGVENRFDLGDLVLAPDIAPMGKDGIKTGTDKIVAAFAAEIGIEFKTLLAYRFVAAMWPATIRIVASVSWSAHRELIIEGKAEAEALNRLLEKYGRVTKPIAHAEKQRILAERKKQQEHKKQQEQKKWQEQHKTQEQEQEQEQETEAEVTPLSQQREKQQEMKNPEISRETKIDEIYQPLNMLEIILKKAVSEFQETFGKYSEILTATERKELFAKCKTLEEIFKSVLIQFEPTKIYNFKKD